MPLPTLLQKGHLVAIETKYQKEFDDILPIDYIMEWVRKKMRLTGIENRVLILKSDTASGKTTVVPPYLYDNFQNKYDNKIIAVTQPRIITTMKNNGCNTLMLLSIKP